MDSKRAGLLQVRTTLWRAMAERLAINAWADVAVYMEEIDRLDRRIAENQPPDSATVATEQNSVEGHKDE